MGTNVEQCCHATKKSHERRDLSGKEPFDFNGSGYSKGISGSPLDDFCAGES